MWRHIACSLQGPSHRAENLPCQDDSRVQWLDGEPAGVLVACVADGAGSASHSGEGSQLACDAIIAQALAWVDAGQGFDDFRRADAVAWCPAARQTIEETADARDIDVREFATTLCAAVLSGNRCICIPIGDGAIVLRGHGAYGIVCWPQSGEYANTTNFLTGPGFQDHIEFVSAQGDFTDVALFTDGMERLALDFTSRTPHLPFFEPLFKALRTADDSQQLEQGLRDFLQSDPVTSRSDDDKSLVLATRGGADNGAAG